MSPNQDVDRNSSLKVPLPTIVKASKTDKSNAKETWRYSKKNVSRIVWPKREDREQAGIALGADLLRRPRAFGEDCISGRLKSRQLADSDTCRRLQREIAFPDTPRKDQINDSARKQRDQRKFDMAK